MGVLDGGLKGGSQAPGSWGSTVLTTGGVRRAACRAWGGLREGGGFTRPPRELSRANTLFEFYVAISNHPKRNETRGVRERERNWGGGAEM